MMDPQLMSKVIESYRVPDVDFMVPGKSVQFARAVWLLQAGMTLEELALLADGLRELLDVYAVDQAGD